jgi:hypothetical protein
MLGSNSRRLSDPEHGEKRKGEQASGSERGEQGGR